MLLTDGAAHVASVFDELSLGALLIHGIGLDEIIERYRAHKKMQESKSKLDAVTSVLEANSLEAVFKNPALLSQVQRAFTAAKPDRTEKLSRWSKWAAFIGTFLSMLFMSFHGITIDQVEWPSDECRKPLYFLFALLGFLSTVLLYRLSDRMKEVSNALEKSVLRNFNNGNGAAHE